MSTSRHLVRKRKTNLVNNSDKSRLSKIRWTMSEANSVCEAHSLLRTRKSKMQRRKKESRSAIKVTQ